ncbi:MAG: hypothetical protein LBS05_02540 [Tannerellaceae bacterium]|jgi:hypothetical protein|nr:hypothetical protein [Tannerellaceae bacterium]
MKAKSFILTLFAIILCIRVYGQEVVAISIPSHSSQEGLDRSQMRTLESVATDIVTTAGYLSASSSWPYVMQVLFIVEDEHLLRGESRNLTLVDTRLALSLHNLETGQIYASFSKRIRGGGKDRRAAVSKALALIDPSDAAFGDFLAKGQRGVVDYYEKNAAQIMARADASAGRQNFDAAIATLIVVPESASYYEDALEKAVEYYRRRAAAQCRETLQMVKTLAAGKRYAEALEQLLASDLGADCATGEDTLIEQIAASLSEEERRHYEREREERLAAERERNVGLEHERQRINALVKVAEEYFDQMTTTCCDPEED